MGDSKRNILYKDDGLRAACEDGRFLLFDGAFGTMLQRAGLAGLADPPDLLNLTHAGQIEAIQRAYVDAGCDVVTTATFNSSPLRLDGKATVEDIYAAATAIARAAGAHYVAGDIGPCGEMLEPYGDLEPDNAYEAFVRQARAAEAAGCDLIAIETMADLEEAKAAARAALDTTELPVFVTLSFGKGGRTFMGVTPEDAVEELAALGVQALGLNCSLGPREAADLVARMAAVAPCTIIAQPNAGMPRLVGDETVYDMTPEDFASAMEAVIDAGATVIGGCCGTDPTFTAALRALIDTRNAQEGNQA